MIRYPFTAPSSDGIHTLRGVVYLPDGEIKGYFHIVHGMTEYIGRYDRLMTDLCRQGYLVFGYDHLGHGLTADDDGELGYIAKKKGYDLLCRDVKVFSDAVRAEYGAHPYYLMGHSMGSFVVRLAAEKYVKPDRLIVMGTGGPNPAVGAGLAMVALIRCFKGEKHISRLIDTLAFGSYNKRFASESDPATAWLTRDPTVRETYEANKFCTFKFTVSAMGDLFHLLKYANRRAWFKAIPGELPILLISGENDPVGNYGKGVRKVYRRLQKNEKKVRCILYPDGRHEIINDITYEQVLEDLLAFVRE